MYGSHVEQRKKVCVGVLDSQWFSIKVAVLLSAFPYEFIYIFCILLYLFVKTLLPSVDKQSVEQHQKQKIKTSLTSIIQVCDLVF